MKGRIKEIRKALDLTQREFADKLGIARGNVGAYEVGKNAPSDAVISLICREFNVNEEWLRTGAGEMFRPAPINELDLLAAKYHLTNKDYIFIEKFLGNPAARNALEDFCIEFASAILAEEDAMLSDTDPFSPALPASTPAAAPRKETIEELEAAYEKSLGIVSKKGSPASSTTGGDARKRSDVV